MSSSNSSVARAFISCSLRNEDQKFVEYVCAIIRQFNIETFGTVGKFSASAENPTTLMKRNIDKADMVVVCATSRYFQRDIHNKKNRFEGISEMIHVETGMAMAKNKPIIVFVQKGTNVGNFIPNITQYIELDGSKRDLMKNFPIIKSIILNTCERISKLKGNKKVKKGANYVRNGFALLGVFVFVRNVFFGR